MASHDTAQLAERHRLLSEIRPSRMAKADLMNRDVDWKLQIGKAIARVKGHLSIKEFAKAIAREPAQVSRWIDGKERPQFDAIFAVEQFRTPLVLAIAELAHDVEITTTVTIRRTA
jgi:hypothetical protein